MEPTAKLLQSVQIRMMSFMISRYNQDVSWVAEYAPSMILYDRSDNPIPGSNIVPNLGTDIADKLHFIIVNYNNLPDVCVYTKANIFKYISKEEFDQVKDNREFTPLLTKNHEEKPDFSFYKDGIYWEKNNMWYLNYHPYRHDCRELQKLLGIDGMEFVPFAPGSNYILTRENIQKHPVEFYIQLYNLLTWSVYPGEAQVIERGMYTMWKP